MTYLPAYTTTSSPWGSDPESETYTPVESDPWWREALGWVRGLLGTCYERNPQSWQEHYLTRCLRGARWDGNPCPGSPDPRRAALAASRDPTTAAAIARKLEGWNEGWAPTAREMTDPRNALLWVFAVAGGIDCVNSREPDYPAEVWAWVRAQTADWTAPQEPGPTPTVPPSESWWRNILEDARANGSDMLERALEEAARMGFDALPEEARRALAALQAEHYGNRAGAELQKYAPLLLGGLLFFTLRRK